MTTTLHETIFHNTLAKVVNLRNQGAHDARTKLSSSDDGHQLDTPSGRVARLKQKASAVHERNKGLEQIGQLLVEIGRTGVEKVAGHAGSSPGGSQGGGNSATPETTRMDGVGITTDDGRMDPVAEHTLNSQLMSGEAPSFEYTDPTRTRAARGGPGYELDQGNLSSAEAPSGEPRTSFPGGTGKNLADASDNADPINNSIKSSQDYAQAEALRTTLGVGGKQDFPSTKAGVKPASEMVTTKGLKKGTKYQDPKTGKWVIKEESAVKGSEGTLQALQDYWGSKNTAKKAPLKPGQKKVKRVKRTTEGLAPGTVYFDDVTNERKVVGSSVKTSAFLASLVPDKEVTDMRTAWAKLSSMNINSPNDALFVLQRTAMRHGVQGRNVGEMVHNFAKISSLNHPQMGDLWRMAHLRTKRSVEEARSEIAAAKETVEGVVKATGELPTTEQVAQASGVSPVAANVAIYETGELIAATGGSVSAPGQAAQAAPAPMPGGMMPPGGMGAMPMPVGGAPGAPPPMDPSMMGGAPPMDPSMMGGAPPMPPGGAPPMPPGGAPPAAPPMPPAGAPPGGMPVQASAGYRKSGPPIHPARLFNAVSAIVQGGNLKLSATTPTLDITDEPQTGGRQDDEMVVDPSGYSASNTIPNNEKTVSTSDFLTGDEKSLLASTLSSNSAQVSTGPADTDQTSSEVSHLTHDPKPASTDGIIDGDGEQVKGTGSQDMSDSSMKTSRPGPLARSISDISDELMLTLFPNLRKASMEDTKRDAMTGALITPVAAKDEHKKGGDFTNADGSKGEKINDTTTTATGSDDSASPLRGNA